MSVKTAKKFKWCIVAGLHIEDDVTYDASDAKANIIDTDLDLGKAFNSPGSKKFELVRGIDAEEIRQRGLVNPSDLTPGVIDDGLEAMTLEELKAMAVEEEIPLSGAKSRSAIIRKIRAEFAISPPIKS